MRVLPTATQVQDFLKLRGWVSVGEAFHLRQFVPPSGSRDELSLVIPDDDDVEGGEPRLEEAVRLLAVLEAREPDDLAYSMAHPHADLLLPTLPEVDRHVGAIPVLAVEGLLDGLRGAIAAGVMLEEGASTTFDKASRGASRIARQCQLGHSEPGSFRFRILVPMTPPTPRPRNLFNEVDPIERRAVIRVARLLSTVPNLSALDAEGSNAQLMAAEVPARMAESFQRTVEAMPGQVLTLGVSWSPFVTPPVDVRDVAPVRLERSIGKIFTRYADDIRQSTRVKDYRVEGKVMTLRKQFNRDSYNAGPDQRMVAVFEKSTGRQVRLVTSSDVFRRLCDALKEEEIVIAEGDLVRIGKLYALNPIRSLKIFGRGDEGVLIAPSA